MKKIFTVLLFFFLINSLFIGSIASQTPSTQGTEFYLTYLKNGYWGCNGSTSNQALKIIISALNACSVTIRNPNSSWIQNVTIPDNGVITVTVPELQGYNTVSESIQNRGIVATATSPISLYISNEATNSFDASFVLPTTSLSDEYITQHYAAYASASSSCPSTNRTCLAIIATEDNTVVDITPSVLTAGGHPANIPFSVTLNNGQTYYLESTMGLLGDFSGTHIKSRDCKKIQVFNGTVITTVPNNLANGADHIFEQTLPIVFWGKKFVLTPSLDRPGGDFVKITALNDNTQINKNGLLLATINAKQTYSMPLPASPASCFIETSNPCAVNLYQTTGDYDGSMADPSMLWISPVEQQIKDIVFATFQDIGNNITHHYVNIVTNSNDVSSMQLDGTSIASSFVTVSGNSNYSYARMQISHGNHHLTSNTGFTAHIYGFGYVKGYAYSVGSSTYNLNREIFINDIPQNQWNNGEATFCDSTIIHFSASGENYETMYWNLGDGFTFYGDTAFDYTFSLPGTYTVTNIIKLQNFTCESITSLFDTVYMTVNIVPIKDTLLSDSVCIGGSFSRWGFEINAVTKDSLLIDSAHIYTPCGITYCKVKALLNYQNYDTIRLCPENLPLYYGDYIFNNRGDYATHFSTVSGCDSIVLLTVLFEGTTNIFFLDTVCMGFYYDKTPFHIDFLKEDGTFEFELFRPNDDGCDTVFHLSLTVIDPAVKININLDPFCLAYYSVLEATSKLNLIVWNTGDSVSKIAIDSTGTYIATSYGYNCFVSDSVTIDACCPPENYVMPNMITPTQKDGFNDYFGVPENYTPFIAEIDIYNRYGIKVFHSIDTDFKWDGSYKGTVTPGTYYYVLVFNGYCKYHGYIIVK